MATLLNNLFSHNTHSKWIRATMIMNDEVLFVTNPYNYPLRDGDEVSIDISLRDNPIISNPQSGFHVRIKIIEL